MMPQQQQQQQQQQQHSVSPPPQQLQPYTENLGALLIELLHFYGCIFDFGAMAIAVHMPPTWGGAQFKQQQQQQQQQQQYASSSSSAPSPALSSQQQQQAQSASSSSASAPPASSASSSPPPSPATPLLLPVRTLNYISLMSPHSANLHFPASRTFGEAQRCHAYAHPDEDTWGHGVFLCLALPSRVLVISDPLFPLLSNNIGKSVFAMWRIKAAFDEGYKLLAAKFSPHGTAPTLLARIIQKMQQQKKKPGGGGGGGGAAVPAGTGSGAGSAGGSGQPTVSNSSCNSPSHTPHQSSDNPLRDAPTPTAPVRGLFHITLPSFFNKPAPDAPNADS
jgi:uncharacterized membrane protein YgcG